MTKPNIKTTEIPIAPNMLMINVTAKNIALIHDLFNLFIHES